MENINEIKESFIDSTKNINFNDLIYSKVYELFDRLKYTFMWEVKLNLNFWEILRNR